VSWILILLKELAADGLLMKDMWRAEKTDVIKKGLWV